MEGYLTLSDLADDRQVQLRAFTGEDSNGRCMATKDPSRKVLPSGGAASTSSAECHAEKTMRVRQAFLYTAVP